jgi:hypothetical protein
VVKEAIKKSLSSVYRVTFISLSFTRESFLHLTRGKRMYIEVTDAIAITIALTTSITLIITTAIRNAKLTRYIREMNERK